MGILSQLDAITGGGAAPAAPGAPAGAGTPALAPQDGAFSQGLRQGMTAAGGQLHALAGGVGEALGARDFAREQYAKSLAAEQLAAQQAPAVNDWHQVTDAPDLATGMRRAGQYVAGLAGQSAPAIGLGLGAGALTAATGGGALPMFAAGTAAVAPMEVGGALQRQQHDPAALANNSAGMRLGTAALEGVGRAAAMNAVPQLMGGKVLGKVIGAETVPGVLAEGIGGNALAGAASEKISTTAENALNPNRDTSGDNARMLDAAVSGGALGVPFAGLGLAGHALHGKAPEGAPLPGAVPDAEAAPAAKPSLVERFKGAFTKPDESAAEKVAKGQDVIDVDALRAAPPEQQVQMLHAADEQRVADTQSWYQELMKDGTLSPENKEALSAAAQDFTDRANQAVVAGIKVAKDAGGKALGMATEFYNAVTKKGDSNTGSEPMPVKSEATTAADAKIGEVVSPLLAKKYPQLVENPQAMRAVTSGLKAVMDDMQSTGKLDDAAARHLRNWFGDDTPAVLAKLHDTVLGDDKDATERYFGAVNKLTDDISTAQSLASKVKGALVPELQDSATPDMVREMVGHLREYARGDYAKDKPKAQAEFEQRQIEDSLRAHFGDKTDDVLAAFDKDREDSAPKLAAGDGKDDHDGPITSDDGFADGQEYGATSERDTHKQYFGGGNDKDNPTFMLSEQAHRDLYGNENSQAARKLAEVKAANPDMNVSAISARQYAQENGLSNAHLKETFGDANPDDHVMIKAEGIKHEGLSWSDLDKVKLDTHKFPDSASRIEVNVGDKIHKLDAVKVAKLFAQEHMLPRDEHDAVNPMYRLRRQFTEAIGALSDHLGQEVHVPDETVIAHRGGKDLTWGEVQKQGTIKPDDMQKHVAALHDQRAEAVKTGDKATVAEIDKALEKHTAYNDHEDMPAGSGALAAVARKLGAQRQLVEAEVAKNGPLSEGDKQLRPPTMKERALIRDYNKITERYNYEADRLDKQRNGGELHQKVEGEKGKTRDSWATRAQKIGDGGFETMRDMESANFDGRSEIAPDGQVHLATAEHGKELGGRFAASRNMEAGPEGNMLHAANFEPEADPFNARNPDGTITPNTQRAIEGRVQQFELGKSAAARAIGKKGRELLGRISQMKTIDQAELASIVKEKSGDERAATINALYKKYPPPAPVKNGFSTDYNTRVALDKIAAGINAEGKSVTSYDLTRNYTRLREMYERKNLPLDSMLRRFAADLNTSVDKVRGLQDMYKGAEPAAKKPSAFVERVVGKGDVAPAVKAIKASTEPKEIQRAVDALLPHQHDASARTVLEAANERIARLLQKDPDLAYSMQRVDPNATNTTNERIAVTSYIDKVLGRSVDTAFSKMLHAGEFQRASGSMARDLIRVSVHALDPMGTAYHESLHAFFSKLRAQGLAADAHPLMRAADSARVRDKLRTLLKDEPGALAQVEKSLEERAAYMYQFWAAGKLELPARPSGILGHIADFFKRVMGIWTNDARATHIMEYFHSGQYGKQMGDRSAVARALGEGTNERVEKFKTMVAPLTKMADAMVSTGSGRLRGSMIPALVEIADAVHAPMQGDSHDPGYVPAARVKRGEVLNDLAERLAGYAPEKVTDALVSMQKGEPGATPEGRLIMREVRKTLDHMYEYMTGAGVKMGDLGYGKNYFPRVWDARTVLAKEPEFRAMLQQYKDGGKFDGSIDQVIAQLTRADGSELQTETVKPGMQYTKERVLGFIRGADAEPFLNKNLYETINSYVTQGTRRAEWARRFGDDGTKLRELMDRARKEGAKPDQLQQASDYLQGVDGTLGDKINPKLRRAFGDMIVYQNVRLLPLAIFSSLIDPMGVLVRGGTMGEAFSTMKRGFAEIPKGFKKNAAHDDATKLAAQMGVIDSAVLMHALGSTTYTQGMTGNFARKVNDTFFKYNLMEQFNTSMRVGASEAAIGFLGRHADGTASPHSARWLAELGLKPGEMVVKDGRPLLTAAEFEAHGMKPEAARAAADKMTIAVNKWVDGAILRPNAAHKPVWMNDPHFALFAHLKQFVYSFQETILKRVANEARFGNVGPAYALAAYVPFMLAADTLKGMIQGGGQQPDWKKGWGAGDYAFYELQRAGLFGVGQFGIDAAKDLHRGGMGIGTLAGPTVEQLGEAVQTVAGPEQFKTFALNAMPANALFDAGESAITNAID